jgi:pilus assembly protein Flp/PilA
MNKFRKEEDGASLIEYSLLVGLISIAVILAITAISTNLQTIWTNTSSSVNTAAG